MRAKQVEGENLVKKANMTPNWESKSGERITNERDTSTVIQDFLATKGSIGKFLEMFCKTLLISSL